jgi:hypothetical protein
VDRGLIQTLARLYDSPMERPNSANVVLRCPMAAFHGRGGKGSPSLSVEVRPHSPSRAHCFTCGIGGTLESVFTGASELTPGLEAALTFIVENDKGGLAQALMALRFEADKTSASGASPLEVERFVARCCRFIPRYLVERGFIARDFSRWQIGFDPERMRAVFPVWNTDGLIVGTTCRTILPDGVDPPKYRDWPPPFAQVKTRYFYGEHAVDTTLDRVYLVEGPTSAIKASRVLPNVLGMFGASTGITSDRLAKLKRFARRVTLVFDGDTAGREAIYGKTDQFGRYHPGLRETLRKHFVVDVAELPDKQDPASVEPDVLMKAVQGARYLL